MSSRKASSRRGTFISKSRSWLWLWITIPVFLILLSAYLLYRKDSESAPSAPFPADKAGESLSSPPETGKEAVVPESSPVPGKEAKITGDEYKLFFGNEDFNSKMADCDDLFPVYRDGKGVEDLLSRSLKDLLRGPDPAEQGEGYYSSLNPGVKLLGLKREGPKVYADFSRELEDGVAGSCQTMAIRAQINDTLRQFPGIDEVVILVEGSTENVLQP